MQKNLERLNLNLIMPPEAAARDAIDRDAVIELAESFRKLGQLQPILVRLEGDKYRIEAGHRRFLAASLLNWSEIDAIILEPTDEDNLHLERAHENLIRVDLNPVEEARIVYNLVYEDGRGVERCAKLLCRTESWVQSRLEVWQFPQDLKDLLSAQRIKVAQARELNRIKDDDARRRVANSAVEYGASAVVIRSWVNDSQVGRYLEHQEIKRDVGDIQAVQQSEISMGCRVCAEKLPINILRHIWLCPECLGAVRDLSFEVQRIKRENKEKSIQKMSINETQGETAPR